MVALIIDCLFVALMIVPFFLVRRKPLKVKLLTLIFSMVTVTIIYTLFTYWTVGIFEQTEAEKRQEIKATVDKCLADLLASETEKAAKLEAELGPLENTTHEQRQEAIAKLDASTVLFRENEKACRDLYNNQ